MLHVRCRAAESCRLWDQIAGPAWTACDRLLLYLHKSV